jgi:hypothetical protein
VKTKIKLIINKKLIISINIKIEIGINKYI